MRRSLVLVPAFALFACSSGPKLTVASAPDAADPTLARGRDTFVASCKRCHGYPDRNAVSEAEWPDVVKRMGAKAGLADEDREAVLAYVPRAFPS